MNTRRWEIYTLSDPRTLIVRYVGLTFRGKRRFNEHMSRAVNGGKTHRDCWIRVLIDLGLRPLFQIVEQGCGEGWQEAERNWIAHYRLAGDLVNHTDGGEGTPGYVPTPELRQKWSQMRTGVPYSPGRVSAMKGKRHTLDAIQKIRVASTGRVMPESMRKNVSAARKGKPLSPDHKAKLSTAHRGKQLTTEHKRNIAAATVGRKPVLCIETGETYPSVTAAAKALNVNEASVNQAIRKGTRCKGLHFRFL